MNNYQQSLIEEHSHLVVRTDALNAYIYGGAAMANDDKVEYANKCIQLASMKKYEEALRARLVNSGVVFENGQYFERVASIEKVVPVVAVPEGTAGSDFDVDAEKKEGTNTKSDGE